MIEWRSFLFKNDEPGHSGICIIALTVRTSLPSMLRKSASPIHPLQPDPSLSLCFGLFLIRKRRQQGLVWPERLVQIAGQLPFHLIPVSIGADAYQHGVSYQLGSASPYLRRNCFGANMCARSRMQPTTVSYGLRAVFTNSKFLVSRRWIINGSCEFLATPLMSIPSTSLTRGGVTWSSRGSSVGPDKGMSVALTTR